MINVAPRFLLTAALLTGFESAAEVIYECRDRSGGVVFSNTGCGENAELLDLKDYREPERPAATPFSCPSGLSVVVNNLHYPSLDDVDEAVRLAESDHTNIRYRRLIQQVDPEGQLPDRVSRIKAEAFPAAEVPGFSNGVVVNVRICK